MTATHVNELPPELLARILCFCDCRASNCQRLLQLACVCKHWRQVLLDYPQFWTTLECTIFTKLKNEPYTSVPLLVDHLQRWFGRAGDLPRSLTLSFDVAGRKTALLYEYLIKTPQWESLTFNLSIEGASNWTWLEGLITAAGAHDNGCWPQLKTLEIDAPDVRYGPGRFHLPLELVAPNLKQLKITVAELQTSLFEVFEDGFSWTHITHFEFNGAVGEESLAFYLHVLGAAPHLESLRVLDQQSDVTPASPLPPVPLPLLHTKLQHLAVHDSPNSTALLTHVRLPALLSLDISRAYCPGPQGNIPPPPTTPLTDAVAALVDASQCCIKALRLKWTPLSDEDLYSLVRALPSLEYVDLDEAACFWPRSPDVFFERLQQDGALEGQRVLPRLKSFSYNEGYRCRLAQEGEPEFEHFKKAPLDWWMARKGID